MRFIDAVGGFRLIKNWRDLNAALRTHEAEVARLARFGDNLKAENDRRIDELQRGQDRAREPFRWCVYCNVDCEVPEPEHKPDCPSVTGLFPVTDQELQPCPHCGESTAEPVCWICKEPLKAGDFYVLVGGEEKPENEVPGIEGAYFGGTVTCVGCAALAPDDQHGAPLDA